MFNKNSRLKNLALSSSFGVVEQLLVYILSFVYRTIFLMILSKQYLGISGLFTNILQVFSLTELGIGSVIVYRLYKPIKEEDTELCHALMIFYKNIYQVIALVVFLLGCAFFPYLNNIIADTSNIPEDINLTIIYWLFVLQNITSYLFVYSQSLLVADQKNYVISFASSIYNIISTILKILILIAFKDYTYSLISGIISSIIYNFLFSKYIKNKYKYIYDGELRLDRKQKNEIYKDTGSLMCHKIGYVVLNSTDSIILSKYIGVTVLGIYSNYSFISLAIDSILNKMLGSFVSTIGNLSLEKDIENRFNVYKHLLFINFWLVSFCTICFFTLVNPFISVWLDRSYILGIETVIVISCNLFFNSAGIINSVFINANGLFVMDKIRPLIQAVINLLFSVYLVKKIGLPGIFIGTLISNITTTWWRQPYVLFKYIFDDKPYFFFSSFFKWMLITVGMIIIYEFLFSFMDDSISAFVIRLMICVILSNLLIWMLFKKNDSFLYFKKLIMLKIKRS